MEQTETTTSPTCAQTAGLRGAPRRRIRTTAFESYPCFLACSLALPRLPSRRRDTSGCENKRVAVSSAPAWRAFGACTQVYWASGLLFQACRCLAALSGLLEDVMRVSWRRALERLRRASDTSGLRAAPCGVEQ